jgi:DNA-binding NtrC family response regulator
VTSPGRSVAHELRAFYDAMVKPGGSRQQEMQPSLKEIASEAAAEAQRQAIGRALHATRGDKSKAARLLGVDYKTLHLKIKRYGLEATQFRTS